MTGGFYMTLSTKRWSICRCLFTSLLYSHLVFFHVLFGVDLFLLFRDGHLAPQLDHHCPVLQLIQRLINRNTHKLQPTDIGSKRKDRPKKGWMDLILEWTGKDLGTLLQLTSHRVILRKLCWGNSSISFSKGRSHGNNSTVVMHDNYCV